MLKEFQLVQDDVSLLFTSRGDGFLNHSGERRDDEVLNHVVQPVKSGSATPIHSPRSPIPLNEDRTPQTVDPRKSRPPRPSALAVSNLDGITESEPPGQLPLPRPTSSTLPIHLAANVSQVAPIADMPMTNAPTTDVLMSEPMTFSTSDKIRDREASGKDQIVTMLSLMKHAGRAAILEDRLIQARTRLRQAKLSEENVKRRYDGSLDLIANYARSCEAEEGKVAALEAELQQHAALEKSMVERMSLQQQAILAGTSITSLERTPATPLAAPLPAEHAKYIENRLEQKFDERFKGLDDLANKSSSPKLTAIEESLDKLRADYTLHGETLNEHRSKLNSLDQRVKDTQHPTSDPAIDHIKSQSEGLQLEFKSLSKSVDARFGTLRDKVNKIETANTSERVKQVESTLQAKIDGLSTKVDTLANKQTTDSDTFKEQIDTARKTHTTLTQRIDKMPTAVAATPSTNDSVSRAELKQHRQLIDSAIHSIKHLSSRFNALTTSEVYHAVLDSVQPLGPLCDQVRADHLILTTQFEQLKASIDTLQQDRASGSNNTTSNDEVFSKFQKTLEDLQARMIEISAQPQNEDSKLREEVNRLRSDLNASTVNQLEATVTALQEKVKGIEDEGSHATLDILELKTGLKNLSQELAEVPLASQVTADLTRLNTRIESTQKALDSILNRVDTLENDEPESPKTEPESEIDQVREQQNRLTTIIQQVIIDLTPTATNFVKIENLASPVDETYISDKLVEVVPMKIWFRGGKVDKQSGTTRYALIQLQDDDVDNVISRLHEKKWQGRVIRVIKVGSKGYLEMLFGLDLQPTGVVSDTIAGSSDQKPIITVEDDQGISQERVQSRTLAIREDDSTSRTSTPGEGSSSRNGGTGKRRMTASTNDDGSHSTKRSKLRK